MGIIGKEIIQSRVWVDPSIPAPSPNLNYKLTFPITVFEAVRRDMNDENSPTLANMLDLILKELEQKQAIFPGKPANNLMTYAGIPGAVGSIRIAQEIPWNAADQTHDRIPTEKAVGDLLLKLGLVNPDGSGGTGGSGAMVRWSDVIGRPNIYTGVGMNEDGFMTQKSVTEAINMVDKELTEHESTVASKFDSILKRIEVHTSAINPHNITLEQLGGVSQSAFDFHVNDAINPHHITASILGLDRVDNTKDIDKPISTATKAAIDAINDLLFHMTDDVGGLKFVVNIQYNQSTGTLSWIYNDGSKLSLTIPIDGLVDEITYDSATKELVINELGGTSKRVSISDLFIRYIGSEGNNILVEIDGDRITGDQIIKASIIAKGVTVNEMADDAVTSRVIADQSVTGGKIKDLTITTVKYANNSITTEKIEELAITNSRLDARAVDGRVIFTSKTSDRILAVRAADSDPVWSQVVSDMIAHNAINTQHILNSAINSDKLGAKSVITSKIDNLAVTNEKLAANSVTDDKVVTGSITGIKLVANPIFTGVPKITSRPVAESDTNELPDTRWVRNFIRDHVLSNSNIGNREIDGRSLFSSSTKNRALVVLGANSDAIWGLINHEMMDIDAINTDNIVNLAVTADKINDKSIESRHMTYKSVLTEHLADNAVTSAKIFKSVTANRVLAVLTENGNPVYSQINRNMIESNAVGTNHIQDRSVTLSKLQTSINSQRVLAVTLKDTDPAWVQITSNMIADRNIDGRTLFTSNANDVILSVTTTGVDPAWTKINGNMLQDRIIKKQHIQPGAIWSEHLQEKIIEAKHLADRIIGTNQIIPRSITGGELFTSSLPNRILAVGNTPYSNAQWVQLETDMIKDLAVTKDKIFQSNHPYRVLAATQAGVPPEYTMITHQFIVDNTITPNKLQPDFVLHGNPEITSHPVEAADNFQIPSTRWVRKTIAAIMKDFNPDILFDSIDSSMIQDHSIDGSKLMTHPYGPRVLGITSANENVEFMLVEENLIANAAVTSNKLQRNIHLLGSPVVELRPAASASDGTGSGKLIPDCQWVRDRISEAIAGGGTGGGTPGTGGDTIGTISPIPSDRIDGIIDGIITPEGSGSINVGGGGSGGSQLLPGSVTTEFIMDRAVTGIKIFTSELPNRILAVVTPNTDPQFVKVTQDMLANSRIIDSNRLFTSTTENTVLAVKTKSVGPEYTKINHDMLESNIIETDQLADKCVTGLKLANASVTGEKLAGTAMIRSWHIYDDSVTTQKIVDKSVENTKLADKAVDGKKLTDDLELPAHTTVAAHTDYERRAVRNTILSPNSPTGGNNGDIWFRYI